MQKGADELEGYAEFLPPIITQVHLVHRAKDQVIPKYCTLPDSLPLDLLEVFWINEDDVVGFAFHDEVGKWAIIASGFGYGFRGVCEGIETKF